jgi:hypothetical protein
MKRFIMEALFAKIGRKEHMDSGCVFPRDRHPPCSYNLISERYFTYASPTLFNAGTPKPQLSSCFLVVMKDDSIEGIYETYRNCAMISKTAGGIRLSFLCILATGFVLFMFFLSVYMLIK